MYKIYIAGECACETTEKFIKKWLHDYFGESNISLKLKQLDQGETVKLSEKSYIVKSS